MAVSMKTFIVAITVSALLISLVLGVQFAELAKGNLIPQAIITITSPANQTYTSNLLVLNFTAAFFYSLNRTITYSIDKQPNVTITVLEYTETEPNWVVTNGTLSLPELSIGPHILEVYAKTGYEPDFSSGYTSVHFAIADDASTPSPSSTPSPRTIIVPTDYSTIQNAIDNAANGETIIVIKGTYTENLVVNKSVTIRSDNQTVVDGGGGSFAFNVNASKVSIVGFVIQNALTGVLLTNSNNSIVRNNTIRNLIGQDNTAIYTGYNHNSSDCTISDNLITNNSRGIHIINSENFAISDNIIQDNDDFGVRLLSSSGCNLSRNIIARNKNLGIQLTTSPNDTVSENEIEDNGCGIWVEWSVYTGNVIVHNSFVDNSEQARVVFVVPFWDRYFASTRIWDDGYPSGGNYWSNYTGVDLKSGPYQNLTGSDGIGDTPYRIEDNNTDHYPLMHPIMEPSPTPSPSPITTQQPTPVPTQTPTPTSDDNQTVDLTPILAQAEF